MKMTTPPPGWAPGIDRITITAIVCRECGSLAIAERDNGRSPQTKRLQCGTCGHAWREPISNPVRVLAITT